MLNAHGRNIAIVTGPGKLHLFEAARVLADAGWNVRVVTGWLPEAKRLAWLDPVGRLMGQPNLRQRIAGRRLQLQGVGHLEQCLFAECGHQALGLLGRAGVLSEDWAGALGFTLFGSAAAGKLGSPHLVHVRSGAGQGGAIRKARRLGARIVVDHSIAHPDAIAKALGPEFERYGLKCPINGQSGFWKVVLRDCNEADAVLVNSEYVKTTFLDHGFPCGKLAVAYLGVRRDFIGAKKRYERRGPLKLLFTGHFDLRKGVRTLLDACEILKRHGAEFQLQVVGFVGNGRYALRGRTLGDQVRFVDFVPQDVLRHYLANADIFVFPTFAEGSSRSAMEAMGAGLPVITTRACGVPIEDGVNGVYVDPGNAGQLADMIQRLAGNEELRRELGSNACATISGHYSWTSYAGAVSRLYETLLRHY